MGEVEVTILKKFCQHYSEDSHKYFIDTTIDKGMDSKWRFTGFYGEPETAKRHKAWSKL